MNSKKFFDWCRTAVGKIWYKPDRDEVHAELYLHMLDRYDRFVEQGYSPENAEEKTVQAMGDPGELALQLKKAHSSLWPKILVTTRVAISLILVICLLLSSFPFMESVYNKTCETIIKRNDIDKTARRVFFVSDYSDGYKFSATKVNSINGYVCVYLKVSGSMLLLSEPKMMDCFWATDSDGNVYYCQGGRLLGEQFIMTMTFVPKRTGIMEFGDWVCIPVQDLENVKWVELRCERADRDVVLHIDLT